MMFFSAAVWKRRFYIGANDFFCCPSNETQADNDNEREECWPKFSSRTPKKNDQLRPLSSSSFLLLFSPIFPREGICVGGRRKPVEKRTARRKRTRTSRGRGKKRKNNQKKATISRGGGGAVRAGQYCRCRFLRLLQAVNGMAPSYPPIRSHLTGLPEEQLTFWRAALLFFHFFYTPIIFFLS